MTDLPVLEEMVLLVSLSFVDCRLNSLSKDSTFVVWCLDFRRVDDVRLICVDVDLLFDRLMKLKKPAELINFFVGWELGIVF
jgi:hypothetical protein